MTVVIGESPERLLPPEISFFWPLTKVSPLNLGVDVIEGASSVPLYSSLPAAVMHSGKSFAQ